MIPTLNQVFDAARVLLGDVDVDIPGGQVFTNAYFRDNRLLDMAFSDLYGALARNSIPRAARRAYYNLPVNTSYLSPATAGITNFGEPEADKPVMERAVRNTIAVTGASVGAGFVDLTVTAHPFLSGQLVISYGIGGLSDDVNDEWSITVVDANTIRLNGCVSTGTYTSGGTVSDSGEEWSEVKRRDEFENYPSSPGTVLEKFVWTGDIFRFFPSSTQRQLKISYLLSGKPPDLDTASAGVDDSLSYLSNRLASLAAASRGAANRSKILADDAEIELLKIVRQQVRSFPSVAAPRFRRARNLGPATINY